MDKIYMLKNSRCICCDGEGSLVFLSCPECFKVVLMCDEVGSIFDNLKDHRASQPLVVWKSAKQKCPCCGKAFLSDFNPATENQIKEAGISCDEYGLYEFLTREGLRVIQGS